MTTLEIILLIIVALIFVISLFTTVYLIDRYKAKLRRLDCKLWNSEIDIRNLNNDKYLYRSKLSNLEQGLNNVENNVRESFKSAVADFKKMQQRIEELEESIELTDENMISMFNCIMERIPKQPEQKKDTFKNGGHFVMDMDTLINVLTGRDDLEKYRVKDTPAKEPTTKKKEKKVE